MNAYEGKMHAWRKVTTAYRREGDDFIPGLASGPTLCNEYGRTLPFTFI